MSAIEEMTQSDQYEISLTDQSHYDLCHVCVQMDQTKKASSRGLIERSPNVTIHADVCGLM